MHILRWGTSAIAHSQGCADSREVGVDTGLCILGRMWDMVLGVV
jgi:hypothetical protein